MNVSKKLLFIIVLLLSITMVFAFVACDKSSETTEGENNLNILPDESSQGTVIYTVTFNSQGGSSVSSLQYSAGEKISKPSTPTKENYTFEGWYKDALFATEWDFDFDVISANITLYAKWKSTFDLKIDTALYTKSTTINFTLDSTETEISLTKKITLGGINATYGIYFDKECTLPYGNRNNADFSDLTYGENIFYLAVFSGNGTKENVYTLQFYRKKVYEICFLKENNEIFDNINVTEGETFTFPSYQPVGETLSYWYLQNDLTKMYLPSQTIVATDDMVFCATVQASTYSITFNSNGGSVANPKQVEVTFGKDFSFPVVTKAGYFFSGWYTEKDKALTGSNGLSFTSWSDCDVSVVYAKWSTETFEVETYSLIAGAQSNVSIEKVDYNGSIALSATLPTYQKNVLNVFCGWYTYTTKEQLISLSQKAVISQITSKRIFYQKWVTVNINEKCLEENDCENIVGSVTVKKDDETFDLQKDIISVGMTVQVQYNLSKEDSIHTYIGLSNTDFSEVNDIYSLVLSEDMPNTTTLNAYVDEYKLSINETSLNGEKVTLNSEEYTVEKPFSAGKQVSLSVSEQDGKIFAGWYQDNADSLSLVSYEYRLDSFEMPSSDVTLYPVFLENTVGYYYDTAAGGYTFETENSQDTVTMSVKANVNDSYYFGGYFLRSDFSEEPENWSEIYTNYYPCTYSQTNIEAVGEPSRVFDFDVTYFVKMRDCLFPLSFRIDGKTVSLDNIYLYLYYRENKLSVCANMPYAGTIYYSIDSDKNIGSINGENISFKGISCNNSLCVSTDTHDGYTWLGWYRYDDTWTLVTTENEMEIKNLDDNSTYRATWKPYTSEVKVVKKISTKIQNTDVYIERDNDEGGNLSYNLSYTTSGEEYLSLQTDIQGGYIFEGWYVTEKADYLSENSTFEDKEVCLTQERASVINIADVCYRYDLTSLCAKFKAFDSSMKIRINNEIDPKLKGTDNSETGYSFSTTYGSASVIGYYYTNKLYCDIVVKTAETEVKNISSNGYSVSCYLGLTDTKNTATALRDNGDSSGYSETNFTDYVMNRGEATKDGFVSVSEFDAENRLFTYTFCLNDCTLTYDLILYPCWKVLKSDFCPTVVSSNKDSSLYICSVRNSKMNSKDASRTISFRASPSNQMALYSFVVTDSNNKTVSTVYDKVTTFSNIGSSYTVTAGWKNLNDGDKELSLQKNISEAGSVSFSGSVITSEKSSARYYNVTVSAKTNENYTFSGWYDNNGDLISTEETFDFICDNFTKYFASYSVSNIIYTAYWRSADSDVLYEKVCEPMITGYTVANKNSYYTLSLSDDYILTANGEEQSGYCFMGWYNDSSVCYSTEKNYTVFGTSLKDTYYSAWKKITFPKVVINENTLGSVTMEARYNKDTNGIRFTFTASPTYGSYLEYWLIGEEKQYGLTCIYDVSEGETLKTVNTVFGEFGSEYVFNFYFGGSKGTKDLLAKDFRFIGYNSDEYERHIELSVVPADGYIFDSWSDNGSAKIYGDTRDITLKSSTAKEYSLYFVSDTFTLTNLSDSSGSVVYYVYKTSDSAYAVHLDITPNNGYLFNCVHINASDYYYGSAEYAWSKNGITYSCTIPYDSTNKPTISVQFISLQKSLYNNSEFVKNAIHTVLLYESIDNIVIHKNGVLQNIFFKNGNSSFEEKIVLNSENLNEYSFISWINSDTIVQSTSQEYILSYPDTKVILHPRWGKYTVSMTMEGIGEETTPDEKYSANQYEATVSFSLNKNAYIEDTTYISDISFVYLETFDEESFVENYVDKNCYYSAIDLNAGEGGYYIVMLWHTTEKQDEALTSVMLSSVLLSDTSMRLCYFKNGEGKEVADLNKGVYGAEPLYVYTSRLATMGNRICKIGIETNGKNNDFFGTYNYVGGKDINLTSCANQTVYIVYREKLSKPTFPDKEPDDQILTLTKELSYVDNYTDTVYTNTVFGGWYDTIYATGLPYDFTNNIAGNISLYAKWYVLSDYNIKSDFFMKKGTNYQVKSSASYYFVAYGDTVSLSASNSDKKMTTSYELYDLVDRSYDKDGKITSIQNAKYSLPVTAGHLYRITFETENAGDTGVFNVKLFYDLPSDGAKFVSLLPYGEEFLALAKTANEETFEGWYDGITLIGTFEKQTINGYSMTDGEDKTATAIDNKTVVTFVKQLTVEYSEKNLDLKAYFATYTVSVYNTMDECGTVALSGTPVVGNIITLTKKDTYDGFKFNGWFIYDPESGTTTQADTSSYQGGLSTYSYQNETYLFKMQAKNYIFIPSWGVSNAQTVSYTIEYILDEGINNSQNRTVFYETSPNFDLYSPTKDYNKNNITGEYIFEGWYFDEDFKKKVSAVNNIEGYSYEVSVSSLKENAVQNEAGNNVVYLYAKWSKPVSKMEILTDNNGVQYIEYGSYPTARITDTQTIEVIKNYFTDGDFSIGQHYHEYYRKMYDDGYHYYKMEKIRWNVIYQSGNTYSLQTDKILFANCFHTSTSGLDTYGNNWENSYIRSYLNNEFITFALNELEQNYLYQNIHFTDNSSGTTPGYLNNQTLYPWTKQNDTYDYVYLPSYSDVTNNIYDYSLDENEEDIKRINGYEFERSDNIYTDYACEQGLAVKGNSAAYYIRTAGDRSYSVFIVEYDGTLVTTQVNNYTVGIRPCITLEISAE